MYYLEPRYDNCNSFYKKARVEVEGDKKILYSYGTYVVVIDTVERKAEIIDFYSQTTTRHIREFLYQEGFELGDKQFLYHTYTKAGQRELIEKELLKEKKKKERELLIQQRKIEKERQKAERLALKEKIKKDLTKELSGVFSKREINKLVNEELSNYTI